MCKIVTCRSNSVTIYVIATAPYTNMILFVGKIIVLIICKSFVLCKYSLHDKYLWIFIIINIVIIVTFWYVKWLSTNRRNLWYFVRI